MLMSARTAHAATPQRPAGALEPATGCDAAAACELKALCRFVRRTRVSTRCWRSGTAWSVVSKACCWFSLLFCLHTSTQGCAVNTPCSRVQLRWREPQQRRRICRARHDALGVRYGGGRMYQMQVQEREHVQGVPHLQTCRPAHRLCPHTEQNACMQLLSELQTVHGCENSFAHKLLHWDQLWLPGSVHDLAQQWLE
jgi:hypothetical protein